MKRKISILGLTAAAWLAASCPAWASEGMVQGGLRQVEQYNFSIHILAMLLVGVLSGVGQYLLIRAFLLVPASTLAPFNYFHLMLAVIFSMVVFDQVPPMMAVGGMLLITAAGLSLTMPMLISYWLTRNTKQ